MTVKKMLFDDGSSIEWKDRESLKYNQHDGYAALIWIDFEPGFFSRGRVLMTQSLDRWRTGPDGQPLEITYEKREEIIEKVRRYYGRRPLRISHDLLAPENSNQ